MRATMLFLAVTASLSALGGSAARAAEDLDAITTAAINTWRAQREGVVTGQFSVRLYRYGSSVYKEKIPAKEFRTLIDGIDSSNAEGVLQELQSKTGEPSMKGFKPHWGVPIEVSCEGIKWRNEWKGTPHSVQVFNGHERVEYREGIRQATIMPGRTGPEAITLDTLCDLPNESIMGEILASKDKQLLEGGKVAVNINKQNIVFDPSTGFIHVHALVGPKRSKEVRQTSPLRLEGDFLFPRLIVRVEYERDYVRSFEALLIDKARLNDNVSPDAFVVSTPGKTTFVDMREQKTEGIYSNRHVKETVPDVLAFANAGEIKKNPERDFPVQRSDNRWLYASLTLLLLALTWPVFS